MYASICVLILSIDIIVLLLCIYIGLVVSSEIFKEQFDLTTVFGRSNHDLTSVYQYVITL